MPYTDQGENNLKDKKRKEKELPVPLWNLNAHSGVLTEDLLIEHLAHTRYELFYV